MYGICQQIGGVLLQKKVAVGNSFCKIVQEKVSLCSIIARLLIAGLSEQGFGEALDGLPHFHACQGNEAQVAPNDIIALGIRPQVQGFLKQSFGLL